MSSSANSRKAAQLTWPLFVVKQRALKSDTIRCLFRHLGRTQIQMQIQIENKN